MSIDYDRLKDLLNGCTTGQWQSHDYEPDPYCYPGAVRFVIAADWDRVEIAEGQAGPSTKSSECVRKASDFALMALAPDMARELLRLHGGIEVIRDYCAGNARSARAAGMHTLANEMYATVKALAELLEGDTE